MNTIPNTLATETDKRGHVYETSAETARRIVAGLTDVTANEGERYSDGTAPTRMSYYGAYSIIDPNADRSHVLPERRRLLALQYVTLRTGAIFRLSVVHYPDTGHARVSFEHPESDAAASTSLRDRGVVALRHILGDDIDVSGGWYSDRRNYIVQGWTK